MLSECERAFAMHNENPYLVSGYDLTLYQANETRI